MKNFWKTKNEEFSYAIAQMSCIVILHSSFFLVAAIAIAATTATATAVSTAATATTAHHVYHF